MSQIKSRKSWVVSTTKRDFPPIAEPHIPPVDASEYDDHPLNDLQFSILKGAYYVALRRQKENGLAEVVPPLEKIKTNGQARRYLENNKDLLKG